jgi:hypothetical protein
MFGLAVLSALFVLWTLSLATANHLVRHHEVVGQITAKTATTVTITTAGGKAVTVTVNSNTHISVDGTPGKSITDLTTLMRAEAVYLDDLTAVRIRASDIFEVHGTIAKITPASGATPAIVAITTVAGNTVNVQAPSTTAISVDHVPGKTVADLKAGMPAEAVYKATSATVNTGISIEAFSKAFVRGTITKITGTTGVAITTASGTVVNLTVATTTTIFLDGAPSHIGNLTPGMRAEAVYLVSALNTGTAITIEASDRGSVTGEITKVTSTATTNTLVITPNTGPAVTLTVPSTATITLDGKAAAFADLKVGQHVEAAYTINALNAGVATRVHAFDHVTVKGTITKATSTATTNTLVIKPSNGGPSVTLTVPTGTPITLDGKKATFADLVAGMPVTASYTTTGLDTGTATRVAASDRVTVTGTIKTLTPASAGKPATAVITLASGATVTVTFNAATRISVNGVPHKTFADLKTGMAAEVTYQVTATANVALNFEAGTDNDHDDDH